MLLRALWAAFGPAWLSSGETTLKSRVRVIRQGVSRDVLATYEYTDHLEALTHARDLKRRLAIQTSWEFEKELGLFGADD
jgi:hypothetical protein